LRRFKVFVASISFIYKLWWQNLACWGLLIFIVVFWVKILINDVPHIEFFQISIKIDFRPLCLLFLEYIKRIKFLVLFFAFAVREFSLLRIYLFRRVIRIFGSVNGDRMDIRFVNVRVHFIKHCNLGNNFIFWADIIKLVIQK